MPTTRAEVMQALELAALVLPAVDSAANHRDPFVSLIGLDPALVGHGQGRRAGRILAAVLAALRERNGGPSSGVLQGNHKGTERPVEAPLKGAGTSPVEVAK
jgi:hypothetical protein